VSERKFRERERKTRPFEVKRQSIVGVLGENAAGLFPQANDPPRGWQMIAGDRARAFSAEESPNTTRQHAAQNARERAAKAGRDGKCHRK